MKTFRINLFIVLIFFFAGSAYLKAEKKIIFPEEGIRKLEESFCGWASSIELCRRLLAIYVAEQHINFHANYFLDEIELSVNVKTKQYLIENPLASPRELDDVANKERERVKMRLSTLFSTTWFELGTMSSSPEPTKASGMRGGVEWRNTGTERSTLLDQKKSSESPPEK